MTSNVGKGGKIGLRSVKDEDANGNAGTLHHNKKEIENNMDASK